MRPSTNPIAYQLRITHPAARALTGQIPEKVATAGYEVDDELRVVTVTAVEHRGDVYRSR